MFKRTLIFLSLLVSFSSSVQAASPEPYLIRPAAPKLAAKSYVLMDAVTNKLIVEHDADKRVEPASLTKLMTVYIASRALQAGDLSLEQMITVSEKAWRAPGSRMFIEVGKQVSVKDLLNGIIVQSGNDASIALSEAIAGSEAAFVDIMNAEAKRLGMTNSHFMNSTGLPHKNHYSSAHDIALISQAIIQEFPNSYALYKQRSFNFNNIKQFNRNRLLWSDPDVDGLKTGHTSSAGYCLSASALKKGTRLISVVIGTDSETNRERETQRLLGYGFRYFETHTLYKANSPIKSSKIWMGTNDSLDLVLDKALTITIPKGSYKSLQANLELPSIIKAPIEQHQKLGTITVSLNGETLATRDLVATKMIAPGSLFQRFSDYIKLSISSLMASNDTDNSEGADLA